MHTDMQNTSLERKKTTINGVKLLIMTMLLWQTSGCASTLYTRDRQHQNIIDIQVSDYRAKNTNYAKIDITLQDVAEGLTQLCIQM